jgi:hypothetical protein
MVAEVGEILAESAALTVTETVLEVAVYGLLAESVTVT